MKEGKEGNVLFNDTLNTFYLQLYGIRHMVKDQSDSERGNLLPGTRKYMLWNLECLIRLSQREICAHFNEGNLAQFGRSTEK